MVFFAISAALARPSAGIGVVEVQQLEVFCDFCGARATLCGDRRGRGAKTHGFLRFLRCPHNPLGGSAWSRCKNSRFFAISAVLAQLSAKISVVEVQKLTTFVVRTGPRELSRGSRACSRNRRVAGSIPPWSAGRASQDATCILKQLAEQLAQSNLRRATYAEQLAQSNLHRAPCLVLSRTCFTNASCREKERILQRWADLACDVLLSDQPWSSLLGGGFEWVAGFLREWFSQRPVLLRVKDQGLYLAPAGWQFAFGRQEKRAPSFRSQRPH